MALVKPRPTMDFVHTAGTASIGATPVAGAVIAGVSGYIQRVMAAAGGTTTGTITVAVSVNNGSDVASSGLTIAAGSNARAGSVVEFTMAGASAGLFVNEGDCITFTPSGGGGASIPGAFAVVIRGIT